MLRAVGDDADILGIRQVKGGINALQTFRLADGALRVSLRRLVEFTGKLW